MANGSGGQLNQPHSNHYISEDILVEILSHLPAKSLQRFRCVCTPWGALVSKSDFLKKQGFNVKNTRFLYWTRTRFQYIDYKALLSLKKDNDGSEGGHVAMRMYNIDSPTWRFSSKIVGSCNGLLCLTYLATQDQREVVLWNTSIRVVNTLPQIDSPPFDDSPPFRYYRMLYGLGYDSTTDDYKVVFGIVKDLCVTFAIFSLRKGSWGTVSHKHLHSGCADPSHGCLLNGVLHRLDLEPDEWHFGFQPQFYGRPTPKIVSLNLADKKFLELVSLSKFPETKTCKKIVMGTTRNCLFVSFFDTCWKRDNVITIWVMNEYGVYDSWTKLVWVNI